jgi:SAM-dependent methyltransferase
MHHCYNRPTMSEQQDSPRSSSDNRRVYDAHGPRMQAEIDEFWQRMPGPRRFDGLRVMDFGCGTGQLTIDLARRGAGSVLGVELSEDRIVYARERVAASFPEYADRIRYTVAPVDTLEDGSFDCIVTKDTFEHVIGLDRLLPVLTRKLAPGGHMLVGFSPLWFSMFGDHHFSKHILGERIAIPWFHVLAGDRRLLDHANKNLAKQHQPARHSIQEFGFNQLTCREFRRMVADAGLEVRDFQTNKSSSRLADRLGQIPVPALLEKYWIRSVYAWLRRPA